MAQKIRISNDEYEKRNQPEQVKSEKNNFKTIGLIISIVANVFLAIALLINNSNNDERIAELIEENNQLSQKVSDLSYDSIQLNDLIGDNGYYYTKEKLKFFDDRIIFEIKGKGKKYYSYDCMQKVTSGTFTFWAYNKEQAKDLGLKKGGC